MSTLLSRKELEKYRNKLNLFNVEKQDAGGI